VRVAAGGFSRRISYELSPVPVSSSANARSASATASGYTSSAVCPATSFCQVVRASTRWTAITWAGCPATPRADPADSGRGDRAPDAPCRDPFTGTPKRLFDLFRRPHFTLLGLGDRCAAALSDLESGIAKAYLIGPGGLVDDAGHVARAYGQDALVLIRPDGSIGLIADADDTLAVAGYLRFL
jgi:hypothetical protein